MDSPLFPGKKQIETTNACPKPVLFQSWMIVQIVRLSVCWSISCLVAVRRHRRETGDHRVQQEEIQIEPYVHLDMSILAEDADHQNHRKSSWISALSHPFRIIFIGPHAGRIRPRSWQRKCLSQQYLSTKNAFLIEIDHLFRYALHDDSDKTYDIDSEFPRISEIDNTRLAS
jgi:hypothetical protein